MKTIWKYKVDSSAGTLWLPEHKIVHVGYDREHTPCFWAEIFDTNGLQKCYTFSVYGTGNPIQNNRESYVGTMIAKSGFVWHLYLSDRLAA